MLNTWKTCLDTKSADDGRFDECEFIGSPPEGHRTIHRPVTFYGVLTIASLDWLSAQGKVWLETDLRRRDARRGTSHLTLATIYGNVKGQGSQIRVWIQGEKNMPARFLSMSSPTSKLLGDWSSNALQLSPTQIASSYIQKEQGSSSKAWSG